LTGRSLQRRLDIDIEHWQFICRVSGKKSRDLFHKLSEFSTGRGFIPESSDSVQHQRII
jgi:hypothetical protein